MGPVPKMGFFLSQDLTFITRPDWHIYILLDIFIGEIYSF